jgi:carbonic anhydrase
LQRSAVGLAENWLRHIQDVHRAHPALVDSVEDEERRVNLLAELNVVEQAVNVCESTIVQSAWRRGAGLAVHGWIYSLRDGLLVDLGFAASDAQQVAAARSAALARIAERYRAS